MKAREANRHIERLGGHLLRTRGFHRRYEVMAMVDGIEVTATTTAAQHAGDIPIGTLRQLEKDMIPVFGDGWLIR